MKSWADVITTHVRRWTAHCAGLNVKWRPRFAYHFTDVHNAARILNDSRVLSRQRALAGGCMVNENAASVVINDTPETHKRFARLYFRPLTPTQFRNEGLRAAHQRYQGAHCPVPVFFCFDLEALLVQDHVMFSNGSMARPEVKYGDSLELFQSIPFEYVYHDRPIRQGEDKNLIVFHRHAEILVPNELPLDHLAGVACRSDAERQTLLHLLGAAATARWRHKIVRAGDGLFFRRWPYLESVYAVDDTLYVRIAAAPNFDLPITIEARDTAWNIRWAWQGHSNSSQLRLRLRGAGEVELTIWLFDCVAFRGTIMFHDELPF